MVSACIFFLNAVGLAPSVGAACPPPPPPPAGEISPDRPAGLDTGRMMIGGGTVLGALEAKRDIFKEVRPTGALRVLARAPWLLVEVSRANFGGGVSNTPKV